METCLDLLTRLAKADCVGWLEMRPGRTLVALNLSGTEALLYEEWVVLAFWSTELIGMVEWLVGSEELL